MKSQDLKRQLVKMFSKIEGDDTTKYDTQIDTLIDALRDTVAHEPALCALLDEFSDKIGANTAALTIDRRVRDIVGEIYEFQATDETDATPDLPGNYLDVLNIGLAHIGYAMAMARVSNVSREDMEYLNAKVEDALSGGYNGRYLKFKVPTKADAQKALAASSLLPAVELAQRVLSIDVSNPTAKLITESPERIEQQLVARKAQRELARVTIEAFDAEAERLAQQEIADKLVIERQRLNKFQHGGLVDPAVEISPVFDGHYEDQVLLNISVLEGQQAHGSPGAAAFDRAQVEYEALSIEILSLEEKLAVVRERAALAAPVLAETSAADDFRKMQAAEKKGVSRSLRMKLAAARAQTGEDKA